MIPYPTKSAPFRLHNTSSQAEIPTQSPKVAKLPAPRTPRERRFRRLPDAVPRRRIRSACREEPEQAPIIFCSHLHQTQKTKKTNPQTREGETGKRMSHTRRDQLRKRFLHPRHSLRPKHHLLHRRRHIAQDTFARRRVSKRLPAPAFDIIRFVRAKNDSEVVVAT